MGPQRLPSGGFCVPLLRYKEGARMKNKRKKREALANGTVWILGGAVSIAIGVQLFVVIMSF